MSRRLAIAALLCCVACSPDDAPAEQVAEVAEAVVAPTPEAVPLARGRYAPRDECGTLEGAREFRDRFAAAVRARDTDALVTLAAADIVLDFGGNGGTGELRRMLGEPDGALWDELAELTALGCAVNDQGGLTLPWMFEQDLGDADPYDAMLVTGEDVPVFDEADPASRRVATVSWDLVTLASNSPGPEFTLVTAPNGQIGFVAHDKLRSPIDYRLLASSRNGRWSITHLVAGD
jgi:hypothetical protein